MNSHDLFQLIKRKKSFLCVGLDSDINKIPKHLLSEEDPVFAFNKQIIDATIDHTVAYKPNIAFYESRGVEGWKSLSKTIEYLNQFKDDVFTIADAKRGDIGNTSQQYADTFFKSMSFDSVTVAPYMGSDSVLPFLKYEGKFVILLALTSNGGAFDFQFLKNQETGKRFFEEVLEKSKEWGNEDQLMYVVGATKADMLADIRSIIPDSFLLVPGIGAQGGSLSEVAKYGMNDKCGLLVNSSRGIIYASTDKDFAAVASGKALELQKEMETLLNEKGIL
ncbi:MAG: orotidine-5'-phosphate decarboxylase [Hyphomicrobiales bacterium]